jgi:hypothetical protein
VLAGNAYQAADDGILQQQQQQQQVEVRGRMRWLAWGCLHTCQLGAGAVVCGICYSGFGFFAHVLAVSIFEVRC